eukprot:gb/GECG01003219.1/.p1 GENE.gb/GECG01003219.1/~~gb/GECG01003219.1/.p1  ORF type:complete len:420 (+),score=36.13 gb/GECG01003219.1/:1-1260(+)
MGCKASTLIGNDVNRVSHYTDEEPVQHIPCTKKGVERDYDILCHLGDGSFATVYMGREKRTGKEVAVKDISRFKAKATSINRENNVMEHIKSHPHVVSYFGTYKTSKSVSFVLELMRGGEIFCQLVNRTRFPEAHARAIFQQVASGLAYLHSRGIVHRDLKPENLLLTENKYIADVKIADFGLSQILGKNHKLQKICGTWAYAAPEMNDPNRPGYDTSFDCWSLGVLIFLLLSGYHPFDPSGRSPALEIKKRAKEANYSFNSQVWKGISDLAKDLISRLIVKDPSQRYTMLDVLHHPWITEAFPMSSLRYKDGEIIIDEDAERKYPPGISRAFPASAEYLSSSSLGFSSLSEPSVNRQSLSRVGGIFDTADNDECGSGLPGTQLNSKMKAGRFSDHYCPSEAPPGGISVPENTETVPSM